MAVWDGGGNHKGPAIRELLRRIKRLPLERLPAYAPDLNPVEAVWSWLKYGELANYVPADIPGLDDEVIDRLVELKFTPSLLRALWEGLICPIQKEHRYTWFATCDSVGDMEITTRRMIIIYYTTLLIDFLPAS